MEIDVSFYSLGPGGGDRFTASLIVEDASPTRRWAPIRTHMIARVGGVTTILPSAVQVRQGAHVGVPITVISDAGPDTVVTYNTEPGPGGVEVAPLQVQVPRGGRVSAMLDLAAAADAPLGVQDLTLFTAAFDAAQTESLDLPVVVLEALPDPGAECRTFELLSPSWSGADQLWSNWGITDLATTTFGYLPTPRLFRPTDQYQVAWAVKQAEAAGQTIRALGNGWSFSDAVLPQSSELAGIPDLVIRQLLMSAAEASSVDVNTLRGPLSVFSRHFGYAIDTITLDRSLQTLLPGILSEGRQPGSFFFVEVHVTARPARTIIEAVNINDPDALKAVVKEVGTSDASKADRIASATKRTRKDHGRKIPEIIKGASSSL